MPSRFRGCRHFRCAPSPGPHLWPSVPGPGPVHGNQASPLPPTPRGVGSTQVLQGTCRLPPALTFRQTGSFPALRPLCAAASRPQRSFRPQLWPAPFLKAPPVTSERLAGGGSNGLRACRLHLPPASWVPSGDAGTRQEPSARLKGGLNRVLSGVSVCWEGAAVPVG